MNCLSIGVHLCCFCICVPYRDIEWVYLYVSGTVDGSLCVVAGDVEQRAVSKLVRPLDLQRCLTERTGTVVQEL